ASFGVTRCSASRVSSRPVCFTRSERPYLMESHAICRYRLRCCGFREIPMQSLNDCRRQNGLGRDAALRRPVAENLDGASLRTAQRAVPTSCLRRFLVARLVVRLEPIEQGCLRGIETIDLHLFLEPLALLRIVIRIRRLDFV